MKERIKRYAGDLAVRQAARNRLPAWLKLLLPIITCSFMFGTMVLLASAALEAHDLMHRGMPRHRVPEVAVALMFGSSFVAGIAPSLVLANLTLWVIPPLRRMLDANARGVPGGSFRAANRGLLKIAQFSVPIGLAFVAIGIVDPWAG